MKQKTFKAKLYSPLFYSSSEGRTIKTREILSATALIHALAYRYFDLKKEYILTSKEATTPDYSYLNSLSLFVSDMKPIEVFSNERTFRSTDYRSDRHLTTNETNIARNINSKKSVPEILETSGTAWQTVRNYMGIAPGSEYEFTIWTQKELPKKLFFRMGIKQTGEFRAERTDESEVILNKYLLDEVYDIDDDTLNRLGKESRKFVRGNDPRLQHFIDVPRNLANEIAEMVLK